MTTERKRIPWVDQLKGLLILLVVLGHAVGSARVTACAEAQPILDYFYRAIYLFHMPAFFMVAGLLWHTPVEGWGPFLKRKTFRLLVPYWVFGFVSACIYFGLVDSFVADTSSGYWTRASQGGSFWHSLGALAWGGFISQVNDFRCNSVLWFLPCLFSVQCLAYGLFRIPCARRGWLLLFTGALMFFFATFFPQYMAHWPLQLNMAVKYSPFFLFGFAVRKTVSDLGARLPWFAICLLVSAYLLGAWFVPYDTLGSKPGGFLIAFVMAIGGSMIALFLAQRRQLSVVRWCGGLSIGIMLMHKFPLLLLQSKIPVFVRLIKADLVCCLAVTLLIAVVAVLLSILFTWLGQKLVPEAFGMSRQKGI